MKIKNVAFILMVEICFSCNGGKQLELYTQNNIKNSRIGFRNSCNNLSDEEIKLSDSVLNHIYYEIQSDNEILISGFIPLNTEVVIPVTSGKKKIEYLITSHMGRLEKEYLISTVPRTGYHISEKYRYKKIDLELNDGESIVFNAVIKKPVEYPSLAALNSCIEKFFHIRSRPELFYEASFVEANQLHNSITDIKEATIRFKLSDSVVFKNYAKNSSCNHEYTIATLAIMLSPRHLHLFEVPLNSEINFHADPGKYKIGYMVYGLFCRNREDDLVEMSIYERANKAKFIEVDAVKGKTINLTLVRVGNMKKTGLFNNKLFQEIEFKVDSDKQYKE